MNAQNARISGIITDASTGETIPLVNIIKVGTTIGTNSNDEGYYQLELNSGIHELRFSSLAYVDTVIEIRLDPSQFITLDIKMSEDRLMSNVMNCSQCRQIH